MPSEFSATGKMPVPLFERPDAIQFYGGQAHDFAFGEFSEGGTAMLFGLSAPCLTCSAGFSIIPP